MLLFFIKKLFGPSDSVGNVSLNLTMPNVLNDNDKRKLECAFTMEEIKNDVFQMKKK